jgi:hypothetical protein
MKLWRWSETIGPSWLSALPQHSLLQKRAQQLVRMNLVAATFAMGLKIQRQPRDVTALRARASW